MFRFGVDAVPCSLSWGLSPRSSTPSTKRDKRSHRLARATRGNRGAGCASGRLSFPPFSLAMQRKGCPRRGLRLQNNVPHALKTINTQSEHHRYMLSTLQSESQPAPAAIQRFAQRDISRFSHGQFSHKKRCGSLTTPQLYRRVSAFQSKATQAPCRRRLTMMPIGQGSAAQHTPQPLHASPMAGLLGARRWRWMVCFISR